MTDLVLTGDVLARAPAREDSELPLEPAALRYALSRGEPNTQRTYRSTLTSFQAFLVDELGLDATLDALRFDTVLMYREHLQADEDGIPRRSAATVAKQLSALRGFARFLAEGGLAVDPRIQQIKCPTAGQGAPRPISREMLERLLAMPDLTTTAGKRDRALLEVLSRCGLRRSEASVLRWDDITRVARWPDGDTRRLVAGTRTEQTDLALEIRDPKNDDPRRVPITRVVADALKRWEVNALARRSAWIFPSLQKTDPNGRPTRLSPGSIGRVTVTHATAAGLPPDLRTPHVLRHTFCTALHAAGADLATIAKVAGHRDLRTTRRYTNVNDRAQRDAVENAFGRGALGGWS